MTNQFNYRRGSIIRFVTNEERVGEVRMILVESTGVNFKNDGTPQPGFNLRPDNGDWARGYDDQIIEVLKF